MMWEMRERIGVNVMIKLKILGRRWRDRGMKIKRDREESWCEMKERRDCYISNKIIFSFPTNIGRLWLSAPFLNFSFGRNFWNFAWAQFLKFLFGWNFWIFHEIVTYFLPKLVGYGSQCYFWIFGVGTLFEFKVKA